MVYLLWLHGILNVTNVITGVLLVAIMRADNSDIVAILSDAGIPADDSFPTPSAVCWRPCC